MLSILSLIMLGVMFPWTSSYSLKEKNTGLNGVPLKCAAYAVAPFVLATRKQDGNYTFVGTNIFLINWLSEKLKFTPSYVFLNESAIANYGSSNYLLVHLVVSQEVDFTVNFLSVTPERNQMMDFAFYSWMEPYTMVVPRPGESERLFAFIRVFQPTVWLLILGSVLIVPYMMTLFLKIYSTTGMYDTNKYLIQNKITIFSYCATYIANTMTNQGGKEPGRPRLSFRVLIGCWLLMALILVNSYSSTIISSLTVPKMLPPINTFEDLAASKDVGIILLADTVIGQQILEAKSGVLKTLGDQARNNPEKILTSVSKIDSLLKTGNYAFPYLQTFCKFFVVNQYKKEGKCLFKVTDPLPAYGTFSILLQKNSKLTSIFNKALMELWEIGLTAHWVKNSVPHAPMCFAKNKMQTSRRDPIGLRDTSGVFFILGIGASFSTLVFIVEVIIAKF